MGNAWILTLYCHGKTHLQNKYNCYDFDQSHLIHIHTLQLNFLLSDWLFSKYAECIENVHCTPCTAPRLRGVLLVRDLARERHIDWSFFFHWVKLLIFFMFSGILKPFYL